MGLETLLLSHIECSFSIDEIVNAAKYINQNYSVFLTDNQLWVLIREAFGTSCDEAIAKYKVQLLANRFINLLLFKYYPCERTAKYCIIKKLICKPETVLFEMPVLGSRVDVCRINGYSYAYEIKTELDTFNRLSKQISDYSCVFEYVCVVVPKSMYASVIKLVPDFCGICVFDCCHDPDISKIWTKRKAQKSPNIDPRAQLECLSSKELKEFLAFRGKKRIPHSKEGRIQLVLSSYSPRTINCAFKQTVKHSYSANWAFIRSHYAEILPIDVQAFFSSPIEPSLLYSK